MSISPSLSEQAAELIRGWTYRRNLNKSELARRLGVSHTWVTNRLAGHQEISLNELGRFAEVLGVELAELLPALAPANTRKGDGLIELSVAGANRPRSWDNLHPNSSTERPPVPSPRGPTDDGRPVTDYASHTTRVGRTRRAVRIPGVVTA